MMVIPCFPRFFASLAGVSGTVGATTLTEKQLAAHGHTIYTAWDTTYVGHYPLGRNGNNQGSIIETDTTGTSASHTHSLSGVKSGSASSLPPYYALAFIMRVA